jgi:SAM-dependent methyltransferase
MMDRSQISQQMRDHYETVWQGNDAWDLESSPFEQARYERQVQLLSGRHYQRVLEIGCGSGCFTRHLATLADKVLALDISPAAIDRARHQTAQVRPGVIELRAADIMHFDLQADGPWDLIVLSETIYCLGWLYSFFDITWLARQMFTATKTGGLLFLGNAYGGKNDWLLHPCLINTYRDLCSNVGFRLRSEEIFRGIKGEVEMQILMSLFEKGDEI